MIGDFFTKPLGRVRFRNIIMNFDVDEYGTVNVDELMAAHYKRVDGTNEAKDNDVNADSRASVSSRDIKKSGMKSQHDDKPMIDRSKASKVSSWECVGYQTHSEWAM